MGRHAFRDAVERADLDGAVALLAENVRFRSPAVFKPYEGRETVAILRTVFGVFEDFHYTDELEGPDGTHALIFEARVGDKSVQGLDLLRTGDSGEIENLTVMIRPLSGVIALAEAMAPKVGHLAK
jgi:hypothetical protein